MTDGDNVQWLLNDFAAPGGPWFGSPGRGSMPLGWTMSPAMGELAPSVLAALYRNATPGMDNFVAAPSGVGCARACACVRACVCVRACWTQQQQALAFYRREGEAHCRSRFCPENTQQQR
jgi:hypothetical protein